MNYYRWHIGDYMTHTAHLSPVEDVAYRRLLDLCYLTESPIPLDIEATCRLIRMRDNVNEVAMVLSEFFDQHDDGFHSKRADEEISDHRAYIKAQSEKGKIGGRPRKADGKPKESSGLTEANQELNNGKANVKPPTTTTTNKNLMSDYSDGFLRFWQTYPRKDAKPKAWSAWKAQAGESDIDLIVSDVLRRSNSEDWRKDGGKFIPMPASYLNARRWEDGTSTPSSPKTDSASEQFDANLWAANLCYGSRA